MRIRDDLNHFQSTRPAIREARRIAIVGCAGSGKSTLAEQLSAITGLPHHALDRVFWLPGWVPADEERAQARVREIAAGDTWIIEGNYGTTFPERFSRADIVVWFDFPAWFCLYRVVRRWLAFRGQVRPHAPDGCPERITWPFLKYVWSYRRTQRPKIVAALQAHVKNGTVVPVTNGFGLRSFVAAMHVFVATSMPDAAN